MDTIDYYADILVSHRMRMTTMSTVYWPTTSPSAGSSVDFGPMTSRSLGSTAFARKAVNLPSGPSNVSRENGFQRVGYVRRAV